MNLDTNLKPIIPKDLLIDRAISKDQNRYNEDVYLLYNPVGYGGIVAVGQEIVDLIQAFDGATDISTAIAKSRLVGEDVVNISKNQKNMNGHQNLHVGYTLPMIVTFAVNIVTFIKHIPTCQTALFINQLIKCLNLAKSIIMQIYH